MKWRFYRWCRHGTNDKNLPLFSQQMLAEIFKNVVDVAEVVNFLLQTEGYDEVEGCAFAQRVAGCFQQFYCLLFSKLQGEGQRDGCFFAGVVAGVAADLGEDAPVDEGAAVDVAVLFAAAVDVAHDEHVKCRFLLFLDVVPDVAGVVRGPGFGRQRFGTENHIQRAYFSAFLIDRRAAGRWA